MKNPNQIKARRMWCDDRFHQHDSFAVSVARCTGDRQVAVLDVSDPKAIVEQCILPMMDAGCSKYDAPEYARAVLESLGIIAKRRAKR